MRGSVAWISARKAAMSPDEGNDQHAMGSPASER